MNIHIDPITPSDALHLTKVRAALKLLPEKEQQLPDEITDPDELSRLLNAIPADQGGLGKIIAQSTPDTFEQALTEVSTEFARREAARVAIASGARQALAHRRRQAVLTTLPDLLTRLAPLFTEATTALTAAAGDLPAGEAAADPAQVLAADAGTAYRAAWSALDVLLLIGAAHGFQQIGDAPRGFDVATIVDIPDSGPVRRHPTTRQLLDPRGAEASLTVRKLVEAYAENPQLTLIDVARGEYDGINIDLAPDPATALTRATNVVAAHQNEVPATIGEKDYADINN